MSEGTRGAGLERTLAQVLTLDVSGQTVAAGALVQTVLLYSEAAFPILPGPSHTEKSRRGSRFLHEHILSYNMLYLITMSRTFP